MKKDQNKIYFQKPNKLFLFHEIKLKDSVMSCVIEIKKDENVINVIDDYKKCYDRTTQDESKRFTVFCATTEKYYKVFFVYEMNDTQVYAYSEFPVDIIKKLKTVEDFEDFDKYERILYNDYELHMEYIETIKQQSSLVKAELEIHVSTNLDDIIDNLPEVDYFPTYKKIKHEDVFKSKYYILGNVNFGKTYNFQEVLSKDFTFYGLVHEKNSIPLNLLFSDMQKNEDEYEFIAAYAYQDIEGFFKIIVIASSGTIKNNIYQEKEHGFFMMNGTGNLNEPNYSKSLCLNIEKYKDARKNIMSTKQLNDLYVKYQDVLLLKVEQWVADGECKDLDMIKPEYLKYKTKEFKEFDALLFKGTSSLKNIIDYYSLVVSAKKGTVEHDSCFICEIQNSVPFKYNPNISNFALLVATPESIKELKGLTSTFVSQHEIVLDGNVYSVNVFCNQNCFKSIIGGDNIINVVIFKLTNNFEMGFSIYNVFSDPTYKFDFIDANPEKIIFKAINKDIVNAIMSKESGVIATVIHEWKQYKTNEQNQRSI